MGQRSHMVMGSRDCRLVVSLNLQKRLQKNRASRRVVQDRICCCQRSFVERTSSPVILAARPVAWFQAAAGVPVRFWALDALAPHSS